MRNRGLPNARCSLAAQAPSSHAITVAVGRFLATSVARFGPDSAAILFLGNVSRRILVILIPLRCSMPFVQLSNTARVEPVIVAHGAAMWPNAVDGVAKTINSASTQS